MATAELEDYMGVDPAGSDHALFSFAHKEAERLIKEYVGYAVEQADHVEILPPSRSSANAPWWECFLSQGGLQLKHLPVRAVLTVHENPRRVWTDAYLLGEDAWLLDEDEPGLSRSGILLRGLSGDGYRAVSLEGYWDEGRSLRVSYTAGWSEDELDCGSAGPWKAAVLHAASKFFNEAVANRAARHTAGTGAVRSESLAGRMFAYDRAGQNFGLAFALPASVKEMLAPHRHWGAAA